MTVKDARNIAINEIEAGDEYLFIVKLRVCYINSRGRPVYRLYRCGVEFEDGKTPQGSRLDPKLEPKVMQALFPIVRDAGGKADPL